MKLLLLLLFIFVVNLGAHCKGMPKKITNILTLLSFIFVIFIFSTRGDQVSDTLIYKGMYYSPNKTIEILIEPLYLFINQVALSAGLSFNQFLLCLQILLVGLWYYNSKKITEDIPLLFLLFISFSGFFFWGVVLRAAIGLTIIYIAIRYFFNTNNKHRYIIYYLLLIIALFFHYSIIVFIILPFIATKKYSTILLYIVLISILFVPFLDIQGILTSFIETVFSKTEFDRLNGYIRSENLDSEVYPLRYIKNIVVAFFCIYARQYILIEKFRYNFVLNIYITGCIVAMMLSFIGAAGSRVALNFFFFEFLLLFFVYRDSSIKKKQIFAILSVYSILNFLDLTRTYEFVLKY